jgi:hypothetical protein
MPENQHDEVACRRELPRVYFELYVPLAAIGRGEGATVVKTFVVNARDWRRRLVDMGDDGAAEHAEGFSEDLQSFRV